MGESELSEIIILFKEWLKGLEKIVESLEDLEESLEDLNEECKKQRS